MSQSSVPLAENTSALVFAFAEDGSLAIFESCFAAQRQWEGTDVEAEAVIFFDHRGVRLIPKFSAPNRKGSFFGLFGWVSYGIYKLSPDPSASGDSLALALSECSTLEPNPWFRSLSEVAEHFHRQGTSPRDR